MCLTIYTILWEYCLAASAIYNGIYPYSHKNFNLICTKVNVKSDFHIIGQPTAKHSATHIILSFSHFTRCLLIYLITSYISHQNQSSFLNFEIECVCHINLNKQRNRSYVLCYILLASYSLVK